jgi:hypothetical protein
MRPLLAVAAVVACAGVGGAFEPPRAPQPPTEAAVTGALPPLPAGVARTDVQIVFEPGPAGGWKCTVYYREAVRVPRAGRVSGRHRVEVVYFAGPPLLAGASGPQHGAVR